MKKNLPILILISAALTFLIAPNAWAQVGQAAPLPGSAIPQWVNQLPTLTGTGGAASPNIETVVTPGLALTTLYMRPFKARMLPEGTPLLGPPYAGTKVFGYRLDEITASADTYIGPVFVTARGTPTAVKYVNNLGDTTDDATPPFWGASMDQTLHWADPYGEMGSLENYSGPIPAVPHLHGGEVPAAIDGGPDAWFLSDGSAQGLGYYTMSRITSIANEAGYRYPNVQEAAPIWFHDHLLGGTRINVYAGLAGAYLLTDPDLVLPDGLTATGLAYDPPTNSLKSLTIPLVIQDRMFTNSGELFFPNVGINPEHPFWIPEFVGDAIVVNGKAWPNLNVEAKRYRFLMINGSNARFYELSLGSKVPFYVIGTDGGYLNNAVQVSKLVIGPGERYQLIIDFGKFAGKTILMTNTGRTPFPKGTPPQGSTVGRIVQFTVGAAPAGGDSSFNPAGNAAIRTGGQTIQRLVKPATGTMNPAVTVTQNRQLTLNEIIGPGGPLEILVNNTKWNGRQPTGLGTSQAISGFTADGIGNYLSELPAEGTTEVWEIINLTADAHPIHLHLVQFQLLNRQTFNVNKYMGAYNGAFQGGYDFVLNTNVAAGVFIPSYGPPLDYLDDQRLPGGPVPVIGGNPNVTPYLQGMPSPPLPNEAGWKDTVIMYPGQVTRIAVRFAPQDLAPNVTNGVFAFTPNPHNPNATGGTGVLDNYDFVWHCHIVDHEDNEMMRPYQVTPAVAEVDRGYKMGEAY